MGTVKEDFKNPEMIMLGTDNGLSSDNVLFKSLLRLYLDDTLVQDAEEHYPDHFS